MLPISVVFFVVGDVIEDLGDIPQAFNGPRPVNYLKLIKSCVVVIVVGSYRDGVHAVFDPEGSISFVGSDVPAFVGVFFPPIFFFNVQGGKGLL